MPWQAELPFGNDKPLACNETSRTIVLGDRIVPYVLRRSQRRSIGLQIDQRGLRVGAPTRASLSEVEALIRRHGDWIAQKLDEWRSRRRPDILCITDGTRLPFLGQQLEIRTTTGANRFRWELVTTTTLTLLLKTPADAGRILERALREHALSDFSLRLGETARAFGVTPPPLALTSARTRWGSCSRLSGIRLNWRLIHFPPHIVDYVIAHELAHLKEMNHSPRFWAVVEQICPNYRALRGELRDLAKTIPSFV